MSDEHGVLNATRAERPHRALVHALSDLRAIDFWIGEQIAAGLTDAEIEAQAPLALAFINGDLTLPQLREKMNGSLR